MTTDDLFEDLKQLINTKIDGVESKLEAKIDGFESRLEAKMDSKFDENEEIQNNILYTLGVENAEIIKIQNNHERRIKRLEAKAA